jgi:hypothetical protein
VRITLFEEIVHFATRLDAFGIQEFADHKRKLNVCRTGTRHRPLAESPKGTYNLAIVRRANRK